MTKLLFGWMALILGAMNLLAAPLSSPWTSTTNSETARIALKAAGYSTNNAFTGSNHFSGIVEATNVNNAIGGSFTGNGSGLTNLNSGIASNDGDAGPNQTGWVLTKTDTAAGTPLSWTNKVGIADFANTADFASQIQDGNSYGGLVQFQGDDIDGLSLWFVSLPPGDGSQDVVTNGFMFNGTFYWSNSIVPFGGIGGMVDNSSAAAGIVGESRSTALPLAGAITLTTATAANITNISLTAGDWEVSGNANYSQSGVTVTETVGGVTVTSATVPTDGSEVYSGAGVGVIGLSAKDSVTLPPKRISLSSTTTVYLVGKVTFSVGSVTAYGRINARRVR